MRLTFGPFTIDSDTRQLFTDNRSVHLSPKAFDLLWVLIEKRPRVVDKAELHTRIWPGTFVVDANLNVLIGEIRRALDDDPREPRFVRTVHKVGYAFCGAAEPVEELRVPDGSGRHTCWLVGSGRTLLLSAGDNVIGRDPQCNIWLDEAGVSRHHARIRVAGHEASIEDLESTNGTFVRDAPIESRTRLADGDVVRLGTVELTFKMWSADRQKATERIRRG